MLAPTSTRNGACWMARGDIGTRWRISAFDGLGEAGRLVEMLRLGHLPQDQVDRAFTAAERRQQGAGFGGVAAHGRPVLAERHVEHLGTGHRRTHRRIGVDADEQVRLVVVGKGGARIEGDGLIAAARQQDADAEAGLDRGLELARDRQHDVLLEGARGTSRAGFGAAVSGVDHDRAHACGLGQERRCLERWRDRTGLGRRRRGRLGGGRRRRRRQDVDRQAQLGAFALLGGAVARKRRPEREFDGRGRHDAAGRPAAARNRRRRDRRPGRQRRSGSAVGRSR